MTSRETYTHGYSPEQRRFLSMRSARRDADFLLPHLRPGMRVLDCGCGGGWLTVGLAEAVAPGEVVGFDRDAGQIEAAAALAAERKQANARFEVANVYELPFPDASFDAALAHTVLEHVSDPLRALKELRRVLKPGAVVGIKDPDYGSTLQEPVIALASEALSLYRRVAQHNGASPYYARGLRRLLREAGFERAAVTASALVAGDDQSARFLFSVMLKPWFQEPAFVDTVKAQGWADQAKLDAMFDALERAFHSPDAFLAVTMCAAIAWVP
jgi:ubiquinone/menaquinone biosynthesis C-methylase UbiE